MDNEEIVTIPNIITLLRLLLMPFFIISLVYGRIDLAILLFASIALSDALDGLSARMMKQKTKFGALMDSTTDWFVLLSTLIAFLLIGIYVPLKIIIVLLIPLIGCYIAKGVYVKRKEETTPTIIGKITVAFAYVTVIVILLNFAYKDIFIWILISTSYSTMLNWIIKDIKLFIK